MSSLNVRVKEVVKQDVHFANVDLEIECKDDLRLLIDALGVDINVQCHDRLENGNDFVSIALHSVESGAFGEPEITISAFCDLIEKLPCEVRNTWNSCKKREFDMGFESGNSSKTFSARLSKETVARVAGLGATIEITIYPIGKD